MGKEVRRERLTRYKMHQLRRFEEFRRKSLNELLLAYFSAFALMVSGFILLFALYQFL